MNEVISTLQLKLKNTKKAHIYLHELESAIPPDYSYQIFASALLSLIHTGWLKPVKASGTNGKIPELAYKYKIEHTEIKQGFFEDIRRFWLTAHPTLVIDDYFKGTEAEWERDKPFLQKISQHLTAHGLPKTEAAPAERSYALVGDEKWLQEQNGTALLKKIGLYDLMLIQGTHDPLMLAVNPRCFSMPVHRHLIVENKATYEALLPALTDVPFTSLIYGAGNKITGNIIYLPRQLPLSGEHRMYYFGDLDYEGITIWYRLTQRLSVQPATAFYEALLERPYTTGKHHQSRNEHAWLAFRKMFSSPMQRKMNTMFTNKGYYPQEALSAVELQAIWRMQSWT